MINLREIHKFARLEAGHGLTLVHDGVRAVRLELNTAGPCRLLLQTGPKPEDCRFLADVEGRETVEFVADGTVAVWPSCEGEVWLWTSEMEASAIFSDAETFTKIANRQPRNHELERVAAKMSQNMDRRLRHLEAEMRAKAEALARENEALKAHQKDKPDASKPAAKDNGDAGGEGGGNGGKAPKPPAKADDGGGNDKPAES